MIFILYDRVYHDGKTFLKEIFTITEKPVFCEEKSIFL